MNALIRSIAVRTLRAGDRLAASLARRRVVLVEARTPMNLAVLRPVYDALRQDPRVALRFTGPRRRDLTRAFAELGLTASVVSRERAGWLRTDLYVNADPWDAVRLRRASRQVAFFHGVAGKYDLDCPASLPLDFTRYDRVAFPNEDRLLRYVSAGIVTSRQAALIGFPKIDVLAQRSVERDDAVRALELAPGLPTAIFAPTFSPASSLHAAGEQIVEALLNAGCQVIVKLHDRSLDPDPRYTGGIDWRARLSRFEASGRFVFADTGDSTRYVLASDVMISDHSSIAFEFCVLDRPIIVYDAPDLQRVARISADKIALLRSAACVVRDPGELKTALREALRDPASRASGRRAAAAQVFHEPGSATRRALRLVYGELDLVPAQDLMASPEPAWSPE